MHYHDMRHLIFICLLNRDIAIQTLSLEWLREEHLLIFPYSSIIFFHSSVLWGGSSPTQEGPGYATAFEIYKHSIHAV